MKFNEDLAAIHGYLCSDGYVIKNPPSQIHKYYRIGLRNTCPELLQDFKERIDRTFGVNARIYRNERCDVGSKEVYYILTRKSTFYSGKWSLPCLSNKLLAGWLRAYFDCDGWVFIDRGTSRHIGLDSINPKGLKQIHHALQKLGIFPIIKWRKNRRIFRLLIYGKENLTRFHKKINFLHPSKKAVLKNAIDSYKTYNWNFNYDLISLLKSKSNGKRARISSIILSNLKQLHLILREKHNIESKVYGPMISSSGSYYYELVIHKNNELRKLVLLP